MTREIKFRAWDTKNKQMLYNMPWLLLDKKTGAYTVGTLDIPDSFGSNEQGYRIHGYLDGGIYFYPAALLMQFTGLQDKNGTDIYEDDIIRYDGDIYAIRWDRYLAQFALHWFDAEAPKGSNKEWHYEDSLSSNEVYEVIGNIYENLELLEK